MKADADEHRDGGRPHYPIRWWPGTPCRPRLRRSPSGEVRRLLSTFTTLIPSHAPAFRSAALAFIAALLLSTTASALQPTGTDDPANTTTEDPTAAPTSALGTGEIKLIVERFGVGNTPRAGEWVGLRVQVADTAARQREVVIGVSGFDPDGDTPIVQRVVTTNPGTPQAVWLYFKLSFDTRSADPVTVTAHEAVEMPADDPFGQIVGFSRGRLLGSTISNPPQNMIDAYVGMIGLLGETSTSAYGLQRYAIPAPQTSYAALGHEVQRIVGVPLTEMPDRWMGLAQFSVLVWGKGTPDQLRGEQAQALREWVERGGGHLVIILPIAGFDAWTRPASNELFDILPAVNITAREGVNLEPLRSLLTVSSTNRRPAPLPARGTIMELAPREGVPRNDALRVLNAPSTSPDGAPGPCIVARRLVGTGAVTLIGIDLNQTFMDGFTRLQLPVDADAFWHRVLGRRGKLLDTVEVDAFMRTQGSLSGRADVFLDQDIGPSIAKTGTAAAGILLGFVIFVLYWIIAGPGGFAVLKHLKQAKHAWVAYVGVGAIFTAIAWTGATLIRPMKTSAAHLTFIDHVYGQSTQRAKAWVSVLIPRYGDATVRVSDEEALPQLGANDFINTITPWEERRDTLGAGTTFPDARPYPVDARSHGGIRVPARATVKQFEIDWAGGPRWRMPIPVNADGSALAPNEPEADLKVTQVRDDRDQLVTRVSGALKHELPGPLTDVFVIVVRGQNRVSGTQTDQLLSFGNAYVLPDPWEPGQVLDLSTLQPARRAGTDNEPTELSLALMNRFRLRAEGTAAMAGARSDPLDRSRRLTALALYPLLEPPGETQVAQMPAARRVSTHNWDLGLWFTQPSIIIIGQIAGENSNSPVPISVDGRNVPTTGRTVVRWVYPLADNPPEVTVRQPLPTPPPADTTKPQVGPTGPN